MTYPRPFSEVRIRTRVSPATLERQKNKIITDGDMDLVLTGPTVVRGPEGQLLAKYLPGALDPALLEETYGVLHGLRALQSDNRGMASGSERWKNFEEQTRSRSAPIASAMIGAADAAPPKNYCRLTAWSGHEWDQYSSLFPLFRAIGDHFAEQVPDRFAVQKRVADKTHPDWVIPGTPFTTITVNNSYPTGVHTDSGDLEAGFSTLAVLRRGSYRGGIFTFPEYRLGVDMQHGDLLLMDAHEWHGNTAMFCNVCGEGMGSRKYYPSHDQCLGPDGEPYAERISVVSYYRTKMESCGSMEEETERAKAWAERRADIAAERTLSEVGARAVEEMAVEATGA